MSDGKNYYANLNAGNEIAVDSYIPQWTSQREGPASWSIVCRHPVTVTRDYSYNFLHNETIHSSEK